MVEREERVTPLRVTDELLGVQKWQEYEGSLEFDIGNMAAFEPSALKTEEFDCPEKREDVCQKLAQEITQSLVAKIFALPSEAADVGRLAILPGPSTPLPRAKPLPKPRPPTKWEIFAQQKGIQKKKRSKLLYDESSGEWRRRYGYKKANNDEDIPIIEATSDDKVGTDPFTQARKEKKERVAKNAKQQKENLKRSAKAGGKSVLPASLQLVTDLGTGPGKERSARRRHLKDEIKAASKTAGLATASVGKFDRQARGEKPGERLSGKRKQRPALFDGSEGRRAAGVADRIIREKSDDVDLNVEKAVGRFEAEARELRHSAKKQRANSKAGGGGKGPRGKGGRSGGDKPQGKAGKRRK
uniref:Ribosome biogenesis regulatory protein n=1 Tax=Tetraselmis sp. GSL018 TaxID=582737 RepID=A0A061RH30_9CHLO|mmetsp:Transcript_37621/g.89356  ORF Transcript_37621/g.89356 Transcript_37621/m.89356 type:complete len:357 (+) Transcript_37621:215-1285(+)|eukprot:CAMPEP_0177578242 /NCGR_PEP_ID=MMETSP0419_2-20121207/237_1 /TAXON_ID=582737 /ORGANISM="Tetraselmis sp., Strain GSL018" /LENGTH=356 /DNA_ID=CAMNT_0019066659 /DNA_START=140 /DNA_END=1210 /DNA_ORIENTATION=+